MPQIEKFVRQFLLDDFFLSTEIETSQNKENQEESIDFFNAQAISFVFGVVLQSLLEFQVAPYALFQKASSGNYDALECLVSLDKNIITHPKIAPIWASLSSNPSGYNFKRISKAIQSKPKSRMNLRTVKITNAAIIELLFNISNLQDWIDYKLKRTELFELFDCVTRDITGNVCDSDFPDSPEARDRAVNREKKRLQNHLSTILSKANQP